MADSGLDGRTGVRRWHVLAAATGLLLVSTAASHAVDCFDGQRIGLFTERHFSELDAATRNRASDPKIDHLAKTALENAEEALSLHGPLCGAGLPAPM